MGKAAALGDGDEEVAVELREWNVIASRLGDDPEGNDDGEMDAGGGTPGTAAVSALAHAPAVSSARSEPEPKAEDRGNDDRSGSPSTSASASSTDAQTAVPRRAKAPAGKEREGEKEKDVVPDAIGRETCPICIVDFEEGDDLRVLPCEGHHRFHQGCVDQWLLELSSSCPLCRQGT